ncbi:MAG: hypothetical protein HFACDABA_03072 [Anaerolineales bacterium]|nr:hypothetical protein [Anaerolineales bacterium]
MNPRISKFLSSIKWQDILKVLLALILIGVVLSRTSPAEITALRDRISWEWLAAGFFLFIAMTLIKSLQYWALLGRQTSYRNTLRIVIIQNALTNFVASTAGVASYLAMFHMEENVKVRKSGAVFILTKAGDLLCMGLFLLVSASFVWTRVVPLHQLIVFILVALAAGLTVFWTAVFLRQTFVEFLRRLAGMIRADRLSLVQKILSALESLAAQDTKTVTQTLALGSLLSLTYMLATMAYGYSRVQSFQIPLEFWGIIFIASLMQFISVIPFQVFGGLGVTEISMVFLYGLFGFVDEIPAILVALRVLFYLFNLILLAYVPLDTFLDRAQTVPADGK